MSIEPLLFTQPEIVALARRAGFNEYNAKIAAAIALCEAPYMKNGVAHSNFHAVGDQNLANATWGYSYGGFQIRSLRAQKGTGGVRDEDLLLDPLANAKAARAIKQGAGGWMPWSTYTGGQYKAYLQDQFPPPKGSYVVVSGDSLSKITAKLGNKFTWMELAQANGLQSPYSIRIGQILLLPSDTVGA